MDLFDQSHKFSGFPFLLSGLQLKTQLFVFTHSGYFITILVASEALCRKTTKDMHYYTTLCVCVNCYVRALTQHNINKNNSLSRNLTHHILCCICI